MFTPKFNIGALVLIATKPPVEGTVTGFHNSDPAQEPFYCVRRSDTLEDNWYRECDLQHPQPTAQANEAQPAPLTDRVAAVEGSINRIHDRLAAVDKAIAKHTRKLDAVDQKFMGIPVTVRTDVRADIFGIKGNGVGKAVELNGLSFFNFVTESPVDKAARELREAQDARNKAQAVVNDLADKLKAADNALKDANVLRDNKRKAYEAAANVPAGICDTRF